MLMADKYAPRYVPPEKYRPKPANSNKKVEKVWGFTVLSFFVLLGVFAVKYLVDFLLLPKIIPDLFPFSAGALILWFVSTIIFVFIALKFVSRIGFFYPFANLIYAVLAFAWPYGLYGLGDVVPVIVGLLIAYAIMALVERVMLWIFILVGFARM